MALLWIDIHIKMRKRGKHIQLYILRSLVINASRKQSHSQKSVRVKEGRVFDMYYFLRWEILSVDFYTNGYDNK